VWDAQRNYPGTAFTRSIGDQIAEGLGVTANPEFLEYEMRGREKFIVLASDGVFEFLTSQTVGDIVARFYDPTEACRAVVAEAYRMWLVFETRTDDITIVVLELHKKHHHSLLSGLPQPQRSPATPRRPGERGARRSSSDGLLVSRDSTPTKVPSDSPKSRPILQIPSYGGDATPELVPALGIHHHLSADMPLSPFASSPVGQPETNPRRRSFNSTGRNAMNVLQTLAQAAPFEGVKGEGDQNSGSIAEEEEDEDEDGGEGETDEHDDDDDDDGSTEGGRDKMRRAGSGASAGSEGRALVRQLSVALRQNYLFAQLPKRRVREAAQLLAQQKIATPVGQPVIEPSSAANHFFLVLNGQFEVMVSAEMVRVRVDDGVSVPDYQAVEPEEYMAGFDDDEYEDEVAYAADAMHTDDGNASVDSKDAQGGGDGGSKGGEEGVIKLTINDVKGDPDSDGSGGEGEGGSNGANVAGCDFVLVHRYEGNWQVYGDDYADETSGGDSPASGGSEGMSLTTDKAEAMSGDRARARTTTAGGLCCSFGELGLLKRQPRAARVSVVGHTRSGCGGGNSGGESLPADDEVVLYTLSRDQFLKTLTHSTDAEVAKLAKMRLFEQEELAKRLERKRRNRNNTPQATRPQRKTKSRRRQRKPSGEGLKQRKLSSTV
jgi:hypothetical protein